MDKLSKLTRALLAITLVVSLTLNIATLVMLKSQSNRIDLITNLTNQINQRISQDIVNNNKEISEVKEEISEVKEEANDIMTPSELAEYLDIDIKEIYKLIIDNPNSDFPYIKVNGEVRFSKKAVQEYMSNGNKILN